MVRRHRHHDDVVVVSRHIEPVPVPPRGIPPQDQEWVDRLSKFIFEEGAIYTARRGPGVGRGDVQLTNLSAQTVRFRVIEGGGRSRSRTSDHKVSRVKFAFEYEMKWRAPANYVRSGTRPKVAAAPAPDEETIEEAPMAGPNGTTRTARAHPDSASQQAPSQWGIDVPPPVDLTVAADAFQDLADVTAALLRAVKRSGSMPGYLDPQGVELVIQEAEAQAGLLRKG